MPSSARVNRRKLLGLFGGAIAAPYLAPRLRVRAGGLADPAGELRQRFSGGRRHRYAVAHSLPEDERTVRADLRGREPGRRGRHAGCGCGGEIGAGRLHGRPRRHRQQRARARNLRQASLRSAQRFHLHRRHVAIAEHPRRQEGPVLVRHQGIARRLQEGAAQIHLRLRRLRHHAASLGRDDEQHGRRRGDPHSLPRRRPGADRSARRPRRSAVRQSAGLAAGRARRPGEGRWPSPPRSAFPNCRTCRRWPRCCPVMR